MLDIQDYKQLSCYYNELLDTLSATELKSIAPKKTEELRIYALGSKLLQHYAISDQLNSLPMGPITFNEFNKPMYLSIPFNTSHQDGQIIVVVSEKSSVGVDITSLHRDEDDEFLSMVLSPIELEKVQKARPLRLFPVYWAVKEAFLKNVGGGLMNIDSLADLTVGLPEGFETYYLDQLKSTESFTWMPSSLYFSISLNNQLQAVQTRLFTWKSDLVGAVTVTDDTTANHKSLAFNVSPVSITSLIASANSRARQ